MTNDRIDGLRHEPKDYPSYGEAPYVGLGQLLGKIQLETGYNCGNGISSCEVNLLDREVKFTVERSLVGSSDLLCEATYLLPADVSQAHLDVFSSVQLCYV